MLPSGALITILLTCALLSVNSQDSDLDDIFDSDFDELMSGSNEEQVIKDELIEQIIAIYSANNRDHLSELELIISTAFWKFENYLREKNMQDTTTQMPTTTTTTTRTPKRSVPSIKLPVHCGDGGENLCVKRWNCKNQKNSNGKLLINIRKEGECHYLETCCSYADMYNITVPSFTNQVKHCGLINRQGIFMTIEGNTRGESDFGEYPWIVGIFNMANEYRVGGSLISSRVALSTANRLSNDEKFKVRAGDWDMSTENDILPYQERLATVHIHESFLLRKMEYNIALLFLNASFTPALHITPICLPSTDQYDLDNCIVAGWNRHPRNGRTIVTGMKLKVTPCDEDNESLLCVNGHSDDLQFSIGSALACPKLNKKQNWYYQIGAWSHGYSTNQTMFTNVINMIDWIRTEMQNATA